MVSRNAMDQYVNTELADGAVARDVMDQYVIIIFSDGPQVLLSWNNVYLFILFPSSRS